MTKYLGSTPFGTGANSAKYRNNWDEVFGAKKINNDKTVSNLLDKYPLTFGFYIEECKRNHLSPLNSMGLGWWNLLEELGKYLEPKISNFPVLKLTDVKMKAGRLKAIIIPSSETPEKTGYIYQEVYDFADKLEDKSKSICPMCAKEKEVKKWACHFCCDQGMEELEKYSIAL